MQYKPGICTFCGSGCGNFLKIDSDKVAGTFPSKNHPASKGRLCMRGWNIHELLNSSERIMSPMKRNGSGLQQTTYDDAAGILVEKLKNISPQQIGFLASSRSSNEENFLLMKLARSVFRTNNISLGSESAHYNCLDVLNRGTGMAGMTGSLEEIRNSDFILIVDFDVTKQNPIIGSEIYAATRSGARLVTIDSRNTQIAGLSSRFLQPRPGSIKTVIALMAKTIIEKGLTDNSFIKKHTEGFEEFRDYLNILTGRETASTGLEKEDIDKIAVELAGARSAMVFFPSGISGLGEDTISHIYNLFLITGKIGKEDCGVNPVTSISNLQGAFDMGIHPDLLTGFQKAAQEPAAEKFKSAWSAELSAAPGGDIYDLLENGNSDMKALIVADHDDGIINLEERIKGLDFVAYIGTYKNRFMDLADIVFPAASYIETDGTYTSTERRVQLLSKMIDPPEGIMEGWQLYTKIAKQAGAQWSYSSPADIMGEIASLTPSYSGITHEKLKRTGGIQWPCNDENPEGTKKFIADKAREKIKFIFIKGVFHSPEPEPDFPVLLRVGKSRNYWHKNSLMEKTFVPKREYDAVLLLYPEGYIEISAEDAKKIGVRDGWAVRVISKFGETRAQVMTSDRIRENTAYIECFSADMLKDLFSSHIYFFKRDEDTIIPVRIEKI